MTGKGKMIKLLYLYLHLMVFLQACVLHNPQSVPLLKSSQDAHIIWLSFPSSTPAPPQYLKDAPAVSNSDLSRLPDHGGLPAG